MILMVIIIATTIIIMRVMMIIIIFIYIYSILLDIGYICVSPFYNCIIWMINYWNDVSLIN